MENFNYSVPQTTVCCIRKTFPAGTRYNKSESVSTTLPVERVTTNPIQFPIKIINNGQTLLKLAVNTNFQSYN